MGMLLMVTMIGMVTIVGHRSKKKKEAETTTMTKMMVLPQIRRR